MDTAHVAGRLFDRLRAHFGVENVFMDVVSIDAGVDFAEAIEHAVSSCAVLLALIGPRWVDASSPQGGRRLDDPDDIVTLEIGAALRRGIRVIPVLVDGASMPERNDIPDALVDLLRRQGLRLEHTTFDEGAATVISGVQRALEGQAGELSASPKRRPKTVIGVAIAVVTVAVLAAVVLPILNQSQKSSPPPSVTQVPPLTSVGNDPVATTSSGGCFSFDVDVPVVPNPQASTHDVTLKSASSVLDRQAQPPTITVAGQVAGRAPSSAHLWIVGNPDPRTVGTDGKPGSGRFYPSAEIRPDSNGCWRNVPQSVGYSEAMGITEIELLVQVDDNASAEFGKRPLHPDGFTANDLGQLGVDTIAFFSVPTV